MDNALDVWSQVYPDIDSSPEVSPLVKQMVQRGDLGMKTGKGFYEWTPESAAAFRRRLARGLVEVEKLSQEI